MGMVNISRPGWDGEWKPLPIYNETSPSQCEGLKSVGLWMFAAFSGSLGSTIPRDFERSWRPLSFDMLTSWKRISPSGKHGPFSLTDVGEQKKLRQSWTGLSDQVESVFNTSSDQRMLMNQDPGSQSVRRIVRGLPKTPVWCLSAVVCSGHDLERHSLFFFFFLCSFPY